MIKKRLLLIATLLILSIGCIFAQGRRQSNKTVNTNRPTGAPIEHFKKFDTSAPYVKVALNAYSFTKNLNDYIKGRSNDPMTLFDLIDFVQLIRSMPWMLQDISLSVTLMYRQINIFMK